MMEILSQYVVVIVMAICLAVGYIIKHSLNFLPNKYIPLVMAVLGTVLNMWVNLWTFTPEILLGGLASGLAATGAFELVRNIGGS
jgi:flagellar biosynthesis protein FliQ